MLSSRYMYIYIYIQQKFVTARDLGLEAYEQMWVGRILADVGWGSISR